MKNLKIDEERLEQLEAITVVKDKQLTGYASIDRPWLKYYKAEVNKIPLPEMSMFQFLEYCNKDRLNLPALELRTSQDDFEKAIAKYNYKKMIESMKQDARSFYSLGIKPNEIIPMILPNIPESRILIYALNILGATPYPISPMLSMNALDKILKENEIKNLVIFGGFYEKYANCINPNLNSVLYLNGIESLPRIIRRLALVKDKWSKEHKLSIPSHPNIVTWDEFTKLKEEHKKDISPYYQKDHVAAIIGTSGTTGVPKGVCLTDDSLNAIAIQHMESELFDVGEVEMDVLIQSIGYGFATMHYTGCGGLKNVLIPELITTSFPNLLCKIKPDHFTGGPIHFEILSRSKEFNEGKIHKMRNLTSGGATLSKKVEEHINKVSTDYVEHKGDNKVIVRQGLGITENGGCGTYTKEGAYKFGSVGVPLPLETMGIFVPNTDEELPYGVEGEICISGPTIMKEYLKNPEETEKVLKKHRDGKVWLHLGDLGIVDSDGCFYITDRIKNIFMRRGFNVHPSKITEYISSIPIVKECIVVGVEHPEEQCVPVAFVVLQEEARKDMKMVEEVLKSNCYNNLDEPSIPYEWYFVDALPRNLGGKIENQKLISQCGIDYFHCYPKKMVLK